MEKLRNIAFDSEDRELFLIDDLRLKANAIRFSILPKMQLVMNYAISQIDETYEVNVLDDCMIAQAQHFRLGNRQADVKNIKLQQYKHINDQTPMATTVNSVAPISPKCVTPMWRNCGQNI